MNTLAMFAAVAMPSTGNLIALLFWVAIGAVILWAIIAIIKQTGIILSPVVRIVFVALVSILLILLLFKVFGVLI